MLMNIRTQKATKTAAAVGTKSDSAVFVLNVEKNRKMLHSTFKKLALKMQGGFEGKTFAELEDSHWQNLAQRTSKGCKLIPLYAIDNEFSLYPEDCEFWNMNKFTGKESMIHEVCRFFSSFSIAQYLQFSTNFVFKHFRKMFARYLASTNLLYTLA